MASFSPDDIERMLLQMKEIMGSSGGSKQTNRPDVDNSQPNPLGRWDKAAMGFGMADTALKGYLGLKQHSLANKQFNFTKQAYQTNVANQAKANNFQLDQAYGRALNPQGTREEFMKKWGY